MITDDIPVPDVQPKSFTHTLSASPKGVGQQSVHFSDDAAPSPSSNAKSLARSKSKALGLSLRRVTPDKRSPANDGHSTTGASFVSRLTGRSGRSSRQSSVHTTVTPVQSNRASSRGTRAAPRSVERRQKMDDEYYQPTLLWADDESEEEDLADGDLPSLKRAGSAGSRGSSPPSRWRAANDRRRGEDHDGEGQEVSAAAAAAAATAAALGGAVAINQAGSGVSQTSEQLKVAGFWSQLDGDDDDSSDGSKGRRGGSNYKEVVEEEDDDDESEEEMPNDERRWRRSSLSPPRNRASLSRSNGTTSWRVRFDDQSVGEGDSVGLDLHSRSYADDDEEDATKGRNYWNLLEKAACFRGEDDRGGEATADGEGAGVYGEGEDLGMEVDKYKAIEESYEGDDPSTLDRTYPSGTEVTASGTEVTTGEAGASGARTESVGTGRMDDTNTKTETTNTGLNSGEGARGNGDGEETGVLACITLALTTVCGFEAAAAAANNDPSGKESVAKDDLEMRLAESIEDAAIELQYHPDGENAVAMPTRPSPKYIKKKKKGLRKLLHLPSKRMRAPQEEPLRKTIVTTTTQSSQRPEEGDKSRITNYLASMTFEQEILDDEGDIAQPAPVSPGSVRTETVGEVVDTGRYDDENNWIPTPPIEEQEQETNAASYGATNAAAIAARAAAAALASRPSSATSAEGSGVVDGDGDGLCDEEELESESASWTANRKNSYLRQLADRAKMEYATKAGTASAANDGADVAGGPSGDGRSGATTGVTAAVVAGTAAALSRSSAARESDDTPNDGTAAVGQDRSSGPPEGSNAGTSYNADYNSFSPTEKRQFLRLLNAGTSPQDAARTIALKRSRGDGKTTNRSAAPAEAFGEQEAEEYQGEEDDGDENELEENDEHFVDGRWEGPTARPSRYLDDKVSDPPGDVLHGSSGESAELSTQLDEAVANQREVASLAAVAPGNSKSTSRVATIASLAALPLVPAVAVVKLRSRSRSKSREQNREALQKQQQEQAKEERPQEEEEWEKNEDLQQQKKDGQQILAMPGADGLVSSGIGYYDAYDRGFEAGNVENHNIDSGHIYSDSGLLGDYDDVANSNPVARGKSRRGKLLGAAVTSGLAAKVASRRHGDTSRGRKLARSDVKYKNVSSDDAVVSPESAVRDDSHIAVAAYASPNPREYDYEQRATKSDFSTKSHKSSLSSALNFMNISKPIKPGNKKDKSSKFQKLDSDLALDQVAPSRSAEVEGVPSWLLPRDDSETDDEEEEQEREEGGQGNEKGEEKVDREEAEKKELEQKEGDIDGTISDALAGSVEQEAEEGEDVKIEPKAQAPLPTATTHETSDPTHINTQSALLTTPRMTFKSIRERNVVTPTESGSTGNTEDDNDVRSPQESKADSLVLSPGDSLLLSPGSVFSPGTVTPTSSQGADPMSQADEEVSHQEDHFIEKENEDGYSIPSTTHQPVTISSSHSNSPANHAPLNSTAAAPTLPVVSSTGPDEDAMSYATGMTSAGSTWTTASKSKRKRHKGAASKRLQQAKLAENTSAGWLNTIRDAASTQGQVWDAEVGWVDYTEPEDVVYEHDQKSIGSLQLAIPSKRKQPLSPNAEGLQRTYDYVDHPEPVDFPEEWAKERETMSNIDEQPASVLQRNIIASGGSEMHPVIPLDKDSIFDATAVQTPEGDSSIFNDHSKNMAVENSSIFSDSTEQPTCRSVPRHRPTDRRKASAAAHHSNKPVGWKDSMENTTAHMMEMNNDNIRRYGEYEKGWTDQRKIGASISTTDSSENKTTGWNESKANDTAQMMVANNANGNYRRQLEPRQLPRDQRMIGQQHLENKPIGWKESMENVTAQMVNGNCRWDYKKGWVQAGGAVDDDTLTEMTGLSLEPKPDQGNKIDPSRQNEEKNVIAMSADTSPMEADDSCAPSQQLPSVAEEGENLIDSFEEADEDNAALGEAEKCRDKDKPIGATTSKNPQPQQPSIGLPSLVTTDSGSDKENQESENGSVIPTPQQQQVDHYPHHRQKPPLPEKKRSLHQWLEEQSSNNNDAQPDPVDESGGAVVSRESKDPSASTTNSNHQGSPKLSRSNFSNMNSLLGATGDNAGGDTTPSADPFFGVAEDVVRGITPRTGEVQVVKEKCDDTDSDLFEPTKITENFDNLLRGDSNSPRGGAERPTMESFESQGSNDGSPTWIPPPPPTPSEEERSAVVDQSDAGDGGAKPVALRARVLTRSSEKRTHTEQEQPDTEARSDTSQVNMIAAVSKSDPPSNSYARNASSSWVTKKNVEGDQGKGPSSRKAADSWIKSRSNTERVEKNNSSSNKPEQTSSKVGSLRSRFETKGKPGFEKEAKPVFVPTAISQENDVFFRSTAMGIRLKRGENGFVHVVSVTEATAGSSIVRDGIIEPEDRVMEAAGVDLRSPITNSQWGEAVTVIRNAPRPMKFVVASGPKRKKKETAPAVQTQTHLPPAPAKYVMESRLSKSPEGQQVLESISASRTYDHSPGAPILNPTKRSQLLQASAGRAGGEEASDPPKETFFKRIANSCISPGPPHCISPGPPHSPPDQHDDDEKIPMAHLQFLRTNPTIARVKNAASRRYPALCGRPDTIFEEPDDDKKETKAFRTKEGSHQRSYGMSRTKSAASSTYDGSQTSDGSQTLTLSTLEGTKTATAIGSDSHSGDNTAFLETLALNSAVASKPTRPWRDESANMAISQKLGNTSFGGHRSHRVSERNNELGWPEGDELPYKKDIIENASAYSSNLSQLSFQKDRKSETAAQAELLAAAKVEHMMNDLHNVDPEVQCEI